MNTIDNYFTVKESEISKEDITVFTMDHVLIMDIKMHVLE
jgi:hypothetical protein